MPGPIKIGNAEADFAASVATATKLAADFDEPANTDEGAEDDPGETEAPPDDAEGSEDDAADTADDAGDSEEDADDADDPADAADDASVEAARELFLAGDLAAGCKALGLDPKVFELNEAKFKAMRSGLTEAKTLKAAADKALADGQAAQTRAEQIIAAGKAEYGPLVDLKHAIGLKEWGAVKELVEALAPAGVTWQEIGAGIVEAARGQTPAEAAAKRELKRLREAEQARLAKEKADKEAADAAAASTAMKAKNLAGAEARLKGTDFEGIDGAAERLVQIVSDNWDYQRKGLKIKPEKCLELLGADPIISKLVKLKKIEARRPAAKPRSDNGQFRRRGVVKPPAERKPAKASKEDEFKASIAIASRLEAAERRQTRGA